jgi:hypothetical protein
MKRTVVTLIMLTAALRLFAQQDGRQQFDLYGGEEYDGTNSSLNFVVEGMTLVVSGTASGVTPGGGGGYIIESRENLEFNGSSRLIIRVFGIDSADKFNTQRLLKLELNKRPQQTATATMKNRIDPDYINARNGEAVFDISRLRNIKSINLVFFDCAMRDVRIEIFYE